MKAKKWIHIIGWIALYFFWVMVFQKRAFSFSQTATVEFCYLIFIAANVYFNFCYSIPEFLYKKKYGTFGLLMLTGIIVAALLRVPLATFLNKNYFLAHQAQPAAHILFINSFLNIFIWVICIVAGKVVIDRFRFQQYIDEMARQKEQAELDFLNAQFNPHFLFNSINSIYGHIDKHNITARNMLLTFSDMLRYQLYECNSNTVSIEKEMSYIRNYIALQKARKDEGLMIELYVADNVLGFSIAPLLFIGFVENSFKYVGSGDEAGNKVAVSFIKEGNLLHFKCYNTKETYIAGDTTHNDKGIGIANAQRRLALLYADKHMLNITDAPDHYEVNLKIQVT